MNKRYFALLLALTLLSGNIAFAATNFSYQQTQAQPTQNAQYYQYPMQYAKNNTLQGSVVMVPAGATVNAVLTAPLSSEYTTTGQTVTMALHDDFYYDGKLIAEAGSTIYEL